MDTGRQYATRYWVINRCCDLVRLLGGQSHRVAGIAKCRMSRRVGILEFDWNLGVPLYITHTPFKDASTRLRKIMVLVTSMEVQAGKMSHTNVMRCTRVIAIEL